MSQQDESVWDLVCDTRKRLHQALDVLMRRGRAEGHEVLSVDTEGGSRVGELPSDTARLLAWRFVDNGRLACQFGHEADQLCARRIRNRDHLSRTTRRGLRQEPQRDSLLS